MFTVVGSGFGLYGYLPAVVEAFGGPVLLPESYRAKVEARPELLAYRSAIRWTPDAGSALREASEVVIATPPRRQVEVALACLALPAVRTLVLEKPVAPSAAEAHALLQALRRSGRRYRLGYSFLHTAWAAGLPWPRAGHAREVAITWTFMAHHFAHGLQNWKRAHPEGGGPLRFYGVHLVALLALHGYRGVRESVLEGGTAGEPERWRALFRGEGLPDCRVLVDSRSAAAGFRIAAAAPLVDLADPYGAEPAAGEGDRRVAVLKRFLESLREADAGFDRLYSEVDSLWRAAEQVTAQA